LKGRLTIEGLVKLTKKLLVKRYYDETIKK
jgi:hypothetical protein